MNLIFEVFGLTQYVCEKTHRSGGIVEHVIASNNIFINVRLNSFITSSDCSFICSSPNNVKQRKSQRQLIHRNWMQFDCEGFMQLLKPCLKFDFASSIDEARDM